jgi:hypothetical protein
MPKRHKITLAAIRKMLHKAATGPCIGKQILAIRLMRGVMVYY